MAGARKDRHMPDLRAAALTLLPWDQMRLQQLPGGSICPSFLATGPDGRRAFVKTLLEPPAGLFEAEAASLRWLAEAGAVTVPDVLGVSPQGLALQVVEVEEPSPAAAEQFGRDLAALHDRGADAFGAPWPGFAGILPFPNDPTDDWPTFLGLRRILPLLRAAVDAGNLEDARPVERVVTRLSTLVDSGEAPARCHGDLWSGNVLFSGSSAAIVDPSAYGGHREADLAMLCLFSAPHLSRMLAGYHEASPLLDGWRDRLGVHQLVPLLAHTALFGGDYGRQTLAMARRYA